MYPNFIEDRKALGYEVLNDTSCVIKLVLITDSTVLLIRNLPSNVNHKTKRVILMIALVSGVWFNNLESVETISLSVPPTPVVRVQPSYKHTSEVKIVPIVYKRLDKIRLMPTKEMMPLIYRNAQHVSVNEKILKRLRAGDLSSNVDAFAIPEQLVRMNVHSANPGFGLTANPTSTEIALVPKQAQEFNDLSLKFNEPKPNFVMTKDEALKLINETYPGELEITANERISDWQAAKKISHASEYGINPEDYGMTKDNFKRLQRIGLTDYLREGRHPLPPIKLVKAYQMAVKNTCDYSKHSDGKYSSRGEQKIHDVTYWYNESTRQVAGFKKETGDLITGGKYKPRAFDRFLDTMHLGRL